jgi:hypothetical protein
VVSAIPEGSSRRRSHLLRGTRLGLVTADTEMDSARPDAWCPDCERVKFKHGGWNKDSVAFISVKLVCGGCYNEIKIRNSLPVGSRERLQ